MFWIGFIGRWYLKIGWRLSRVNFYLLFSKDSETNEELFLGTTIINLYVFLHTCYIYREFLLFNNSYLWIFASWINFYFFSKDSETNEGLRILFRDNDYKFMCIFIYLLYKGINNCSLTILMFEFLLLWFLIVDG